MENADIMAVYGRLAQRLRYESEFTIPVPVGEIVHVSHSKPTRIDYRFDHNA